MMPGEQPIYANAAQRYLAHADASSYNAGYERPAIRELIGDVTGKSVLDAGCSGGAHSVWLKERGASQVVSIDLSPQMCALAADALGTDAHVIEADLRQPLPTSPWLTDGTFDLVISSLTLHYVEDWAVPLGEFRRLLRPSGRLVISTHHPYSDRRLVDADNYFATGLVHDVWSIGGAQTPVTFYRRTLEQMFAALTDAGFSINAMREPRPSAAMSETSPHDYANLLRQPAFILFAAEI